MRALERRLAYDAGDFAGRIRVAAWYAERGECARAAELYRGANEVDPFVRSLHRDWGAALFECEEFESALREYRVALMVPPDLDLPTGGEKLRDAKLTIVLGDNDEYVDDVEAVAQETKLNELGILHEFIRFNGGHVLKDELLLRIAAA